MCVCVCDFVHFYVDKIKISLMHAHVREHTDENRDWPDQTPAPARRLSNDSNHLRRTVLI